MKRNFLIIFSLFITFFACNTTPGKNDNADTTLLITPLDSMPVVVPPISDTTGIMKTPPVNDRNVILPDSSY